MYLLSNEFPLPPRHLTSFLQNKGGGFIYYKYILTYPRVINKPTINPSPLFSIYFEIKGGGFQCSTATLKEYTDQWN